MALKVPQTKVKQMLPKARVEAVQTRNLVTTSLAPPVELVRTDGVRTLTVRTLLKGVPPLKALANPLCLVRQDKRLRKNAMFS
jgi:hypothetical protein